MRLLHKVEGGWQDAEGGDVEGLKVPGHCILTGDDSGPLLDTGFQNMDAAPYGYVQQAVVEEMGRHIGMVSATEADKLAERLKRVEQQLKFLEATFAHYEELREMISTPDPVIA